MAQPPVAFLASARRPPSEPQEAEAGRRRPRPSARRGCQTQSPRVLHLRTRVGRRPGLGRPYEAAQGHDRDSCVALRRRRPAIKEACLWT
ncbi:hypothetical protein MUK42_17197 [Musa troglodytarum]|uniref:Uncharacterized protein n=1 Tax=Musa troglodytarum TaxID=320322 RepID=A0A9E7HN36_9LILI|nr:hypothetical protein MUK42_17197 [Musa troglodytarum]